MMAKLGPETLQKRLERALRIGGGTHDAADLARDIDAGRMQAWTSGDSLVVTEVVHYPKVSVVNIVIAVGSLDEVMSLQPAIEDFARKNGCDALRMVGRKGWSQVLPQHGWKPDPNVIYERSLH
jgi:hypothetical protein